MRLAAPLVAALSLSSSALVHAAPPETPTATQPQPQPPTSTSIEGQVRAAGTRAPIADAKVMIVAAPADVRVGARAREPLDPASVTWVRETLTDADGRFVMNDVPVGTVRVVVVVPGYARTEVFAEAGPDARAPAVFVRPERDARFRTEVQVDRNPTLPEAEHRVDGERARTYPGSGGDPVRAAQNLPGVARAPGGLGLVAIRGGDPRQTGIYLDGHPIPRAFHVLPVAAVVDPSMIDRVELTPGNFDAAYGGFSGGLLEIRTRRLEQLQGVHGEAHGDLFDTGAAVRAPVGPGGVGFAFRRSHVGGVIKLADAAIGSTGILVPDYWDYIGRFDMPVRRRHHLSVKALGAGDALQDTTEFEPGKEISIDFRTAFHRFDLGYAYEGERARASLSGAVRSDSDVRVGGYRTQHRRGRTLSLRAVTSYELTKHLTLLGGLDFVTTRARRQSVDDSGEVDDYEFESKHWQLGTWTGVGFTFATAPGRVSIRPQARLNVFATSSETRARVDPRLDVRAHVHRRVELFASLGLYSTPLPLARDDSLGLISSSSTDRSHIVVPNWLVAYFDPGAQLEVDEGFLVITQTYQATLGTEIELPWSLGARATLFWRETPTQVRGWQGRPSGGWFDGIDFSIHSPHERAYGLELLLDRSLGDAVHGTIGYTLLRATTDRSSASANFYFGEIPPKVTPTSFDQRHNLVALLVFELPRGFRFGARFRLVSGNPEAPIVGTIVEQSNEGLEYDPIEGEFGSSYGPLFHQLDLRLDKTWTIRWLSIIAYLDVQNAYNRVYPEIWVYSIDWSERGQRIGLPIFPSLGLRVEF